MARRPAAGSNRLPAGSAPWPVKGDTSTARTKLASDVAPLFANDERRTDPVRGRPFPLANRSILHQPGPDGEDSVVLLPLVHPQGHASQAAPMAHIEVNNSPRSLRQPTMSCIGVV